VADILIVYYSRYGSVERMAQQIALGVESVDGCAAKIRCVAEISTTHEQTDPSVPADGPPYATEDDLKNCDGLILGSPSYFGNMAAALKHYLDSSSQTWLSGALIGKPAGVFTATSSHHGGQESVLLSMMIPLLHHGMLISGIPYSEPALQQTQSGGTPYGASHISGSSGKDLTADEIQICQALGRSIAELSLKLG
jgi:NAD(P)H dehydrogenase (quinone)